jgi:NADH:ubiquinone oxidoreductase subunit E
MQSSCADRGSLQLKSLLEAALAERGWAVPVEEIDCFGWCEQGPNVRIYGGQVFNGFSEQKIPELMAVLEPLVLN